MQFSALLDLATELLRQVLKFDQPTDTIVAAFFRKHRNLGIRERHALADMVYTVLRQRLLFQHLAHGDGGAKGAGDSGALERRLAMLAWPRSDNPRSRGIDTTPGTRPTPAQASALRSRLGS